MKPEIKILTDEEKKTFLNHFSLQKFSREFDLVYENQIPPVAVILISGTIQLISKKKVKADIQPEALLGMYNLLNNKQVKYGWRVTEGSELLILEKSRLIEHINDNNSFINKITGTRFFQSLQRS